jgi:DNA-binding SARP family transcriptional activator/DNA-binding beta-propeller fold protein YncE
VEFRILGPLEVLENGRAIALGRLKERIVLAVLLLHANEFVSRERLIDELWGSSPPPTARKAVNVYISKLRRTLTRDGYDPIATAEGGYGLAVDHDQLDAERMRSVIGQARGLMADGETDTAAQRLHEALALWRGPTLAGIQLESFGRDEIAQLDELRLTVLMDRIDCDLALDRHEHVLGELNLLVREHPLRERLRAQQMLALYRADRQADALSAYAEARRTLVDDLGIEPSEALQRLQQAILRHDPSLATPQGTAAVNGDASAAAAPPIPTADMEGRVPRRPFRTRRWPLALAVLVILAACAVAAVTLSTSAAASPRVVPNSLVQLNPRTGRPTLVVAVGVEPGPIAITPTAVWSSNYGDNTVSRYDLRTHAVASRAGFPAQPDDIAIDGDGNAWITSSYEEHAPAQNAFVTRLEAGFGGTSSGTVFPSHLQTMSLPLPMAGYETLGAGYLWVIVGGHGPLTGDDRVALVDLRTNQVSSVRDLHHSATSIAFGYGSAWIGTYSRDMNSWLEAIRAGDGKPTKIALQKYATWGPSWIAVGEGAVWVLTAQPWASGQPGPELIKIDPQTLRILHRLDLSAEQPDSLAVGAGAVWTTGAEGNTVTKIDSRTDRIIRTIPLGDKTRVLCGIAATPGAVWAAIGNAHCDTIGQ